MKIRKIKICNPSPFRKTCFVTSLTKQCHVLFEIAFHVFFCIKPHLQFTFQDHWWKQTGLNSTLLYALSEWPEKVFLPEGRCWKLPGTFIDLLMLPATNLGRCPRQQLFPTYWWITSTAVCLSYLYFPLSNFFPDIFFDHCTFVGLVIPFLIHSTRQKALIYKHKRLT